jgi:hypothetical protein
MKFPLHITVAKTKFEILLGWRRTPYRYTKSGSITGYIDLPDSSDDSIYQGLEALKLQLKGKLS